MERKAWEPYTAVRSEMINGMPFVESRYLTEAVNEIARLNKMIAELTSRPNIDEIIKLYSVLKDIKESSQIKQ